MRIRFLFLLLLFIQTALPAQNESIPIINKEDSLPDPFEKLVYDKVVAYNFNYDTVRHQKLYSIPEVTPEKFNYHGTPKSSVTLLDSSAIAALIKTISDTSTYGGIYADCFTPRLGITFLSGNKAVFNILVCFECGFLEATTPLPASRHSYYTIDTYEWDSEKQESVKSKPVYIRRYNKGFSEAGVQKLLDFCSMIRMKYCKD